MVFRQGVRGFIRIRGDAFGSGNINETLVAGLVSRLSHRANRAQLFGGIEETLVSPWNVVVHLNTKHPARLRVSNDRIGVAGMQPVRPDAHVMRPVLRGFVASRGAAKQKNARSEEHTSELQ